ncbi:MAG: hypothetical protein QG577_1696 [Thermodesulfobacteriota bacterium]|nr:hypothetical protein [Thermodesulfobacteriota bacterium]
MEVKILEVSRNLGHELRGAWRKFLNRALHEVPEETEKNVDHDTTWYSGTWCIKGCPDCPCKIEYVSFVAAYDTNAQKWVRFESHDVCPMCGTPLINACLSPDFEAIIAEIQEMKPQPDEAKQDPVKDEN